MKDYIVMAANAGFIEGKVTFSIRTTADVNLLDFMARYNIEGEEVGYGHERAVGGILDRDKFEKLLERIGFSKGITAAA